jgi:signal recognition particle subunit SRP19
LEAKGLVRERDSRKVIWPSYFDVRSSRADGRRIPKAFCVENPDLNMMSNAVRSLNLKFEAQQDKAYPSRWWKKEGRLLVATEMKKPKLLLAIGKKLKK